MSQTNGFVLAWQLRWPGEGAHAAEGRRNRWNKSRRSNIWRLCWPTGWWPRSRLAIACRKWAWDDNHRAGRQETLPYAFGHACVNGGGKSPAHVPAGWPNHVAGSRAVFRTQHNTELAAFHSFREHRPPWALPQA
jgi:hypothetical protein